MYPTLFISHGAPNFILEDSKSKSNIEHFSSSFKKPKYIIIFSSHYVSHDLKIIDYKANGLMYDFYGFEKELYDFEYRIKSDKQLTLKILDHLQNNNFNISLDTNRTTYDHGVWTVLSLLYKELDIPVIQISLSLSFNEHMLIRLGEALQIFKNEALIISSGGLTHNLKDMEFSSTIKTYAKEFNDYMIDAVKSGDLYKLVEVQKEKLFYQNHPTNEHFLPLFIAYGNAKNKKGISFNSDMLYSNISMESFAFDISTKKEREC